MKQGISPKIVRHLGRKESRGPFEPRMLVIVTEPTNALTICNTKCGLKEWDEYTIFTIVFYCDHKNQQLDPIFSLFD
jgi:hypothetical protein